MTSANSSTPVAETLWLHIGTEKTGTSTIQKLFHGNRKLLASAGLLYPEVSIMPGTVSHVGLVNYAVGRGDRRLYKSSAQLSSEESKVFRDSFVADLRREIAETGSRMVVLSSEHLSSHIRTAKSTARLVQTLKAVAKEVRVVVYLRPQYQAFASLFSTQVKGGRTRPMELPKEVEKHPFNYEHLLSIWQSAPGLASLAVRLFGRSEFVKGNLIDDFFSAIGFDPPAGLEAPELWVNRRLDAGTLEFLRLVNDMTLEGASAIGSVRRSLVAELERLSARTGECLTNEMLLALDAMFGPSNAAVAKRYFPERKGQLFAPCPPNAGVDTPLTLMKAVELGARLWEARTAELDAMIEKRKKPRPPALPANSGLSKSAVNQNSPAAVNDG